MDAECRFTLAVDDHRRVVEVTYNGVLGLDDRKRAVKEATEIMEAKGYRRALVDFSNAEMEMQNPEDESAFADVLISNAILAQGSTAYLSRPGQSINWFIEILARARRFRCKHFTDRDEAYAWLERGG